jgi:hypothetical protein
LSFKVISPWGAADTVSAVIPLLPAAARACFDTALAAAVHEIGPETDKGLDSQQQLRRDRVIRARQALADQRGDVDTIALEHERGTQRQDS